MIVQEATKILMWSEEHFKTARYLKIEITAIQRTIEFEYVQMSRFDFIDISNNRFQYSSTTDIVEDLTTDKRKRGNSTEYPARLLDGSVSTKWCCYGIVPYVLVFDLGLDTQLDLSIYTRYTWHTANDSVQHQRNPTAWNIYVSNDLKTWYLLDAIEDFTTIVGNQQLAFTSQEFKL